MIPAISHLQGLCNRSVRTTGQAAKFRGAPVASIITRLILDVVVFGLSRIDGDGDCQESKQDHGS